MTMTPTTALPLDQMLIRDLVEHYPAVMPLLAELDLDLCCGGGHPLGEALELHGLPREDVLARVDALVTEAASE
jgi:iron-sulfur cluster repair protein YtfE (RIC family)